MNATAAIHLHTVPQVLPDHGALVRSPLRAATTHQKASGRLAVGISPSPTTLGGQALQVLVGLGQLRRGSQPDAVLLGHGASVGLEVQEEVLGYP
jgi:hypothetical protein